ncbi:LruC domain-containing protein [Flagellimonas pacifica]|uniref:LruC domain-containing protein n=1 Tax=Flagellimonas pacifica TaxID=1247520 RepID=A0A285MZR8_9FLAO|nr:LruC domain-containing protein [Allomuricauda parva]SNZ01276.1 LruC domain-containing protein [Allomuricauda parva]
MMFKILKVLALSTFLLIWLGCVSETDLAPPSDDEGTADPPSNPEGPLAELKVPAGFDFSTNKDIQLVLDVPVFLKGAVFSVFGKTGVLDSIPLGKATFDDNGHFEKTFRFESRTDSILLYSNYIGLTRDVRLAINSNTVQFDYRPLYERGNSSNKGSDKPSKTSFQQESKATYSYIDSYNFLGVPDNMAFPDVIAQNLLDDINASLPEYVSGGIPASHPEYLAGKETSLIVTKEADVWVTFVSEGAGYRNALGYYSYPLGQDPSTVNDITQHNIIFPNTSMQWSGGGLIPGDRVYLGRFSENTVISWFLVANGWNGSNVRSNANIYYSDPELNPEQNASLKDHMVLLHDSARELTLLGFEDLRRDISSDDDFNDAVFYAKANPVDAIQIGNVAVIDTSNDADGDGVNDELDDFPFDPNQAFNNFAPAMNSVGKIAFEDLWPSQGDYDFNDLVMSYAFNLIANAEGLITKIEADFTVDNIGGALENGFAFVLPIAPSKIESIEGQVLNSNYISVNANGTETGTDPDESVIFVVGNAKEMQGQTISMTIDFTTSVTPQEIGSVPFNAFLVVNGDRTKEVHLPDMAPTSKGGHLGTFQDFSDPNVGRYYKTETNLPWAINIYAGFTAPPESIPITLQYPKFVNWANSGGTQNLDWYIK